MSNGKQDGMQCSQFEALLAEALEAELLEAEAANVAEVHHGDAKDAAEAAPGSLAPERRAFAAHRQSCAVCGPLFAQTREGMLLLRALPEVDPPKNLVHNILAATSLTEAPAETADRGRALATPSLQPRWKKLLQPAPVLGALLHSRFAMSFCMAFFSLSLTLSLSGVKITDVYKMVSHPSTFGRSVVLQYTQVEAKVTRYYENMRIVYRVESTVQQLRKSAPPQDNNNKPEQQNQNRQVPGDKEKDQQDYSLERDGSLIAHATLKHEGVQL
jgi:hypothetical protein